MDNQLRQIIEEAWNDRALLAELFKEAGILSDWFLYCDTAFRISPPLTLNLLLACSAERILT